jgi:hypothetical protein
MKGVFGFSLQLLSETFLILGRTEQDMIKNIYIGLHTKYMSFLSILIKLISTDFLKILTYKMS